MKTHSKNERTFWKWKHILEVKAHFENESIFQNCPNWSKVTPEVTAEVTTEVTIFGLYLSITAKVRAGNEETLSIRLVEIKRLCSATAQKIRNVPQLYTTLLQFEDIEMGIVNLIWLPHCHWFSNLDRVYTSVVAHTEK